MQAWTYGPVVPSVYQRYKRFGGNYITDVPDQAPEGFSADERDLMQQVWRRYGHFTALQLSGMTHQPGTPWAITRELAPGAIIPNELIRDYYQRLAHERTVRP